MFGLAIYVCHRYRSPGPLLLFLSTAATATGIPNDLRYGSAATTASPTFNATQLSPAESFPHAVVIDLLTAILLALFAIVFLVLYIHRTQSDKTKPHIVLDIGNSMECVHVRCMLLKSVLYAYRYSATAYIESMLTIGLYPCHLLVHWPTFTATHIAKNQTFPFPSKIMMSPWQKRRIRRILTTPDFYVLPLLHFHGNYRLLEFTEPDESSRELTVSVGLTESNLTAERGQSQQRVAVPIPLSGFASSTMLANA